MPYLLSHFECDVVVAHSTHTCSLNGVYHPHGLVQWSRHCSCMHISVYFPWLPGYIDVAQTILTVLTMVGLLPWLVWFSSWVLACKSKGHWFNSQSRAHAWVAGQVPSRGYARGNHTLMFLSLFLPPFPSLKINKIFKNQKQWLDFFWTDFV